MCTMCFQPLVSGVKMVFGKLLKTTRSQVGWLSNTTKFRERCSVFGTRCIARVNLSNRMYLNAIILGSQILGCYFLFMCSLRFAYLNKCFMITHNLKYSITYIFKLYFLKHKKTLNDNFDYMTK